MCRKSGNQTELVELSCVLGHTGEGGKWSFLPSHGQLGGYVAGGRSHQETRGLVAVPDRSTVDERA